MSAPLSRAGDNMHDSLDEELLPPSHPDVLAFHTSAPVQEGTWDPPCEEPCEEQPALALPAHPDDFDRFLILDFLLLNFLWQVASIEHRSRAAVTRRRERPFFVDELVGRIEEVVVLLVERLAVVIVLFAVIARHRLLRIKERKSCCRRRLGVLGIVRLESRGVGRRIRREAVFDGRRSASLCITQARMLVGILGTDEIFEVPEGGVAQVNLQDAALAHW